MQVNEMRLRLLAHDLGFEVSDLPSGPAILGETFLEQRHLPIGLAKSVLADGPAIILDRPKPSIA